MRIIRVKHKTGLALERAARLRLFSRWMNRLR